MIWKLSASHAGGFSKSGVSRRSTTWSCEYTEVDMLKIRRRCWPDRWENKTAKTGQGFEMDLLLVSNSNGSMLV